MDKLENQEGSSGPRKEPLAQAKEPSVLRKILDLGHKVFTMEGLDKHHLLSPKDLQSVRAARDLLMKVNGLLEFAMRAQGSYLASLCKFSYLT